MKKVSCTSASKPHYRTKSDHWWAIIGTSILLSSLQFPYTAAEELGREDLVTSQQYSISSNSTESTEPICVARHDSFMDVLMRSGKSDAGSLEKNDTESCSVRPKCDEINGCSAPLHCYDFRQFVDITSIINIPTPPHAVLVTPHQLEGIIEDSTRHNVCVVVLFYAPWCTFSVQFARKFNAVGRSFDSLPVLAVDLAENEPYKYILAYLPQVAFYYRGKALFKFSLDSSFEDLTKGIANITGFQPLEVNLTDSENDWPVPTHRDTSDQVFLSLAVWWVLFIGLVYGMRSRLLRQCYLSCLRTTTRLSRHRQHGD